MGNNINKLSTDFMLDNFEVTGTDPAEFEEVLKLIDASTEHIGARGADGKKPARDKRLYLSDLTVYSIRKTGTDDEIKLFSCSPEKLLESNASGGLSIVPKEAQAQTLRAGKMNRADIIKWGQEDGEDYSPLLTEMIEGSGLALFNSRTGEWFMVSEKAMNTLAQRIGLNAEGLRIPSLARDFFIAQRFAEQALGGDKEVMFVTKNIGSIKTLQTMGPVPKTQDQRIRKVFAVLGSKYEVIPLMQLPVIYKDMAQAAKLGKMEPVGWDVTHDKVSITFEFPEYADDIQNMYNLPDKMIPTVTLITSDVGESSFCAIGRWRYNGSLIFDNEYSKMHRGDCSPDVIIKGVEEEVFDKYATLPQRLADLCNVMISPADITGKTGQKANLKAVSAAFKEVLRYTKIKDAIGKSREVELRELIETSLIDPSQVYTGYDVVMDCLSLPEQLSSYFKTSDVKTSAMEKFRRAISKAAYADLGKKTATKATGMYLTA